MVGDQPERPQGPDEETTHDVRDGCLAAPVVSEPRDLRTESAREQILRAAARHFATLPYHLVSLDEILAEAKVTKGALYFHFKSKHALAVAIIDRYTELSRGIIEEQVRHQRAALETLIDISYQSAVQDITQDTARAGVHLLEAIGRTDGLQAGRITAWTAALRDIAGRAVDEGDIRAGIDPADVSRLLVAVSTGLRQISPVADGATLLNDIGNTWVLMLPGLVESTRLGYFTEFIRRRTRVAIAKINRC
ncbi:TetR/AcrR family transcriptional regulator [Mycolicibacterium mengxianglii]|uniref:TetR/AcrR family transcriptional regulator n=1 Tax=Mycolicibacterium mengxianglii TaxID=2736649 RepID=UPI001E2E3B2A|nr:TetR/AcrR family transcriptional regulator [Mycolicibacterium mengxianglii]